MQHVEVLSSFASNFNLCRYTQDKISSNVLQSAFEARNVQKSYLAVCAVLGSALDQPTARRGISTEAEGGDAGEEGEEGEEGGEEGGAEGEEEEKGEVRVVNAGIGDAAPGAVGGKGFHSSTSHLTT